ncbi:Hypothetical predicted protein, partial [Pelobates cultripes]
MVAVSRLGRPQVEEVAGGVAVQPHEHVVKRGWSCRLLVRELNLKLPNVPGVNVEVGELAKGLKLPNVRKTNVVVGEPANGLKLPNVRETNVKVLILPTVRFPNEEAEKLLNVGFLCPLLQGMKEKWLLVTGVPESGHYRQGSAEKGGAVSKTVTLGALKKV